MGILDRVWRKSRAGGGGKPDFDTVYRQIVETLLETGRTIGPRGVHQYSPVLRVRVRCPDPAFVTQVRDWLAVPAVVQDLQLELENDAPRGAQVRLPRLRFEVEPGDSLHVGVETVSGRYAARLHRVAGADQVEPEAIPIPADRDVIFIGRSRWFVEGQILNDVVVCPAKVHDWVSRAACLLHWYGDCGELESYQQGRYVHVERGGGSSVDAPHLRISGRCSVAHGDRIVFEYRDRTLSFELDVDADGGKAHA